MRRAARGLGVVTLMGAVLEGLPHGAYLFVISGKVPGETGPYVWLVESWIADLPSPPSLLSQANSAHPASPSMKPLRVRPLAPQIFDQTAHA
jgi:hypothetical protein